MFHLNAVVNQSIDDAQGVEVELDAMHRAIGDLLILLVEIIEKLFCQSVKKKYSCIDISTHNRAIVSNNRG